MGGTVKFYGGVQECRSMVASSFLIYSVSKSLQEHKKPMSLEMSPLKCCVMKSTTQIPTHLSDTEWSGDLSGVIAIRP